MFIVDQGQDSPSPTITVFSSSRVFLGKVPVKNLVLKLVNLDPEYCHKDEIFYHYIISTYYKH